MESKKYLINNLELLSEWDYSKNIGIDPKALTIDSTKKVWWKCKKCGQEHYCSIKTKYEQHICDKCFKNDLDKFINEIVDLFDETTEDNNQK